MADQVVQTFSPAAAVASAAAAAAAAPTPPPPAQGAPAEPSDDDFSAPIIERFSKLMEEVNAGAPVPVPEPSVDATSAEAEARELAAKKAAESAHDTTDPELGTTASKKTRESFEILRTSKNEWKVKAEASVAEADRLKVQLAALQAKPANAADPAEFEALKKEHAQLSEQLNLLAIERNPKFKAYWDGQIEGALGTAKNAVGKDNQEKLARILQMPEGDTRTEQLEALAGELSGVRQGQLGAAVQRYDELRGARQAEVQKTYAMRDKLDADEKAKQQTAQSALTERRTKWTAAALELTKNFEAFKPIEGDEQHNKSISDYQGFVKAFFAGKLPDNMMLSLPLQAMEFIHMKTKVLPKLQAELKAAKDAVKAMGKAGQTGATGGLPQTARTAGAGTHSNGEPKSFEQIFLENNPVAQFKQV